MLLFLLLSCTTNERARSFGGTMDVTLPCDQKMVMVTWKESSLWYATRPMHEDESAETYTFTEKSPYGMNEGTVIIKECRH